MEFPILQDIVIILGLAVLIILIFQKLKMPSILGFLLTGLIAGPHGLSLIRARHEVEMLAEIGVIFLLFVIGIEFSLKGLSTIKKTVFWGGSLQVLGTILATALLTKLMGMDWGQAVFMGFLLSLSSTAIVLKLLQAKGEITAPHGRIAVAILIYQDLIVVPMMLLTPIMAGQTENVSTTLLILLAKVIGVVSLIIAFARYVVPVILNLVVKTRSQELFILTIIVLCFATAWLTSSVGLSLALGAFFAGLIISESDYSHQATANILPFREIFISFFFVSIGMLMDLSFLLAHLPMVLLLSLGVIVLKILVVSLSVLVLRYPPRIVLLTALTLFQVGEFAFLLSTVGLQHGLLADTNYQYFLAISILSMAATPFVIAKGGAITSFLLKRTLSARVRQRLERRSKQETALSGADSLHDHIVIVGYGVNGKNVARAARSAKIPYVIVELNPDTVKAVKNEGEPIIYGDAAQEVILHHAHVHEARVVVVAISDPLATKNIVVHIRQFNPSIYIIVRTRFVSEIEENLRLGANEIIPEEFETSIEIFTRVLNKYLVPNEQIHAFATHVRSQNYEMLRAQHALNGLPEHLTLNLPNVSISVLEVKQGTNKIVGKTVADSELRKNFGITLLAIKRGNHFETQITPAQTVEQDDVLYVFGQQENIAAFSKYLKM
ncbi:monovalent cation:proton antiporter family protein [Cesiribacter andamanensis]|uniref:K(+)/H(+) antiporter n=1 Tax=Cesiribacter andamanensis AMV16 TaxID=1279009 RepID=M7NB48_9BACT|nr:monovalent cation:proton antiporter family protein [Cesiribacter andamanensis]EMR04502.1 K(+)/H(+) antiporter [Cesiribacter andamanensis AMV16]